jgi:hypothetical protein
VGRQVVDGDGDVEAFRRCGAGAAGQREEKRDGEGFHGVSSYVFDGEKFYDKQVHP